MRYARSGRGMQRAMGSTRLTTTPSTSRPAPSPEAAEIRGREAFLAGVARESCPFPDGAVQRTRWLEGWDTAQQVRQAIDQKWAMES